MCYYFYIFNYDDNDEYICINIIFIYKNYIFIEPIVILNCTIVQTCC